MKKPFIYSLGVLGLITIILSFWYFNVTDRDAFVVSEEKTTTETISSLDASDGFTFEEGQPLARFIPEFVEVPTGGVAWDIFGETGYEEYENVDENGMSSYGIKPVFTYDVSALDGQDILMQGYMFPMDPEDKQSKFLFGPFPISCPYHYHAGAEYIIEVHAQEPIPFSWDPVNLSGKLELVPYDPEFNVFYRLHDAKLVKIDH